MLIKQRDGYFLVSKNDAKAALFFDKKAKLKDEVAMAVNSDSNQAFSVKSPGEFEVSDILSMVIVKDSELAFLTTIERIDILLMKPGMELPEKDLDEVGQVDILILENGFEINSELVKFVNRIDPQVLLLPNDIDKVQAKAIFGVEVNELEKVYKVQAYEFDVEEYKLQIITIK